MTPVSNEPAELFDVSCREVGGPFWHELPAIEKQRLTLMFQAALRSQSPEPSSSEVRVPTGEAKLAFEREAREKGLNLELTPSGYYAYHDTRAAWRDFQLSTLSPTLSQPVTGEEVERLTRERDEAARIARDLTKALVDLTPGGSEYFTRCTMLDTYFADIEQCTRVIRERFQSGHQAKIDRVDERRRAEAAEARLSAVEGALIKIVACHLEGPGLLDCIDNSGERYTSQGLADALNAAREALTTITGGENER